MNLNLINLIQLSIILLSFLNCTKSNEINSKINIENIFKLNSLNKRLINNNEPFFFTYKYLETWIPEWNRIENNFEFIVLFDPSENKLKEKNDINNLESKKLNYNINKEEEMNCTIIILTAGNKEFNTMIELEKNRIEYSKKHNYCYIHFICKEKVILNDSDENNVSKFLRINFQKQLIILVKEDCILPHFWRYLGIWRLFTRKKIILNNKILDSRKIEWVLYMDLDAMFTNYEYKIEEIINKYSIATTSIIIAADTKCYVDKYPINNGIILFRNNNFSRQLVFQVLSKQKYRTSLLFQNQNKWNAKGLKDQPLLTNILVEDKNEIDSEKILKYCIFAMKNNLDIKGIVYANKHVTVVSPRVMNSVRRSSVHFRKDNILWHWRSGDWIAHLSGEIKKLKR